MRANPFVTARTALPKKGVTVMFANPLPPVKGDDGLFIDVFDAAFEVENCLFAPAGEHIVFDSVHHMMVKSAPTLYIHRDVDVRVGAKAIIFDEEYRVDSTPARWDSAISGELVGLVVELKKVDG